MKPRRQGKKRDEDEHSEGYEEEDNQKASKEKLKPSSRGDQVGRKKSLVELVSRLSSFPFRRRNRTPREQMMIMIRVILPMCQEKVNSTNTTIEPTMIQKNRNSAYQSNEIAVLLTTGCFFIYQGTAQKQEPPVQRFRTEMATRFVCWRRKPIEISSRAVRRSTASTWPWSIQVSFTFHSLFCKSFSLSFQSRCWRRWRWSRATPSEWLHASESARTRTRISSAATLRRRTRLSSTTSSQWPAARWSRWSIE